MFIARAPTGPAKPPQFSFDKKRPPGHGLLLLLLGRRFRAGVHQGLYLLSMADQGLGQRPRMGQTTSSASRYRVHRTVQWVRLGHRFRGAAGDLRSPRTGHHQRVLPTLAGPTATAAARGRPRRRLLVGAVDGAGRGLPHAGAHHPRYARGFFEALVTDNLDLGRPDTIEIVFDRQIRGGERPPAANSRPRSSATAPRSP